MRSNFHPYECDGPGNCIHCDQTVTPDHDPKTCELCMPLSELRCAGGLFHVFNQPGHCECGLYSWSKPEAE